MEFNEKLLKAEKQVKEFDKIDGFKERHISTIMIALEAGLKVPKSNFEFKALYMLKDVIKTCVELDKYKDKSKLFDFVCSITPMRRKI